MDMQSDMLQELLSKIKIFSESSLLFLPTSLIKDEEGQIKWGSIITGVLTAGLIAGGSSLVSMSHDITEIRTIQKQRQEDINSLPHLEERQKFILQELDQIKAGAVAATNDRFRGSDAIRMENRLEKRFETEISTITRRLDELERRNKR